MRRATETQDRGTAVIAMTVLLIACGGGEPAPAPAPPAPPVLAVVVGDAAAGTPSQSASIVREGERVAVRLTIDGRAPLPAELAQLRWTSSAETIAHVENAEVVGLLPGSASLTATLGPSTVTQEVTVESALLGDWTSEDHYTVRRVRALPDGTFEVIRISRDEDAILADQSADWRRSSCRSCLLNNVYPLGTAYASFRQTGPSQWEERSRTRHVRCGGFAGCQPQPEQERIFDVTLSADGHLVFTIIGGTEPGTEWVRVGTPVPTVPAVVAPTPALPASAPPAP